MIVLDTATWIWRASDPKRLTTSARRAIDRAEHALVSAISVSEVAMPVAKRRIWLDRPVEQWVDIALALPGIQLAPAQVTRDCDRSWTLQLCEQPGAPVRLLLAHGYRWLVRRAIRAASFASPRSGWWARRR